MTTTSPVFTTTYETGGTTLAVPGVYANPERSRLPTDFDGLAGGELNPPFVADFLSAALMHEQCGRHLYRSVAGRTNNPMLKSKYTRFGDETEQHIMVLQELITSLGGDPGYVSPTARATEKLDHGALEATFLLDGSLDVMTSEMAMLDAVVLAEVIDWANWQAISAMAAEVQGGPAREAFDRATSQVVPQEDDHLAWAQQKRAQMIQLQATRPLLAGMTATAEGAVD